jgi:hypothetical protein
VIECAGCNESLISFGLGRECGCPDPAWALTLPYPPIQEQVTPMCFRIKCHPYGCSRRVMTHSEGMRHNANVPSQDV